MADQEPRTAPAANKSNKGTAPSGTVVLATKTPKLAIGIREKPKILVYIAPVDSARESVDINADVSHEGAGGISWESADTNIASVVGSGKSARVFGVNPGVTTITVKYEGWGQVVTDTIEVVAYRVIIEHPHGDPKFSGSATNEFTFTPARVGILTVNCVAKVEPDDADAKSQAEPRIRWRIDAIGTSALTWANPDAGDPTVGVGVNVEARFEGLPKRHDDFGVKTVSLWLDGSAAKAATTLIEVFWPKNATNHPPDGMAHPGGQSPNWFYYWSQVIGEGNTQHCRYGGAGANHAEAWGMLRWNYGIAVNKRRIVFFDISATNDPGVVGVHGPLTGIDWFYNVFLHESVHVDQVRRADLVVGVHPGTCWANGWSWNRGNHNHWRLGAGRAANTAGVCTPAGPGTMGAAGTGDTSLQDAAGFDWPLAWGAIPAGRGAGGTYLGGHPVEQPAYLAERSREHSLAKYDWGDPGKNHRTRNKWDD